MFVLIVAAVLITILLTIYVVERSLPASRQARALKARVKDMSKPAKYLVKKYHSIPEESRPFPNIDSLVKALDTRYVAQGHTIDDMSWHFNLPDNRLTCDCRNYDKTCYDYPKYLEINNLFDEVLESIRAKELVVIESKLKGDLDQIDELETRMREEIELNSSFADDYKQLS